MAVLEIEGRKVEVDDSFKDLSPEEQATAVEEIAQSMNIKPSGQVPANSFMGQVNAGIADTVGGMVDFVNPLDNLGITGSAKTGLRNAMQAIPGGGAAVATEDPQTFGQSFGRGVGEAAGAIIPVAKGAQLAGRIPGAVGAASGEAGRALASTGGFVADAAAGGLMRGASDTAERMGYGPAIQGLAGVAAPIGAYSAMRGLGAVGRGVGSLAAKTPMAGYAMNAARDLKRAIVPMSEGGAREVARTRLQDLAGGPERASELGAKISPNEEFGRTGAEQIGDPNLLGLQRSAADENPLIRERLDARREGTTQSIVESVRSMGGEVGNARDFFRKRLDQFKTAMNEVAENAIGRADEDLTGVRPERAEETISAAAVDKLKAALDGARTEERALWAAVPGDVTVPTAGLKAKAVELRDSVSMFQQKDIPEAVQMVLGNQVGDELPLSEAHGLYSELRRISRVARAGDTQNRNMARIADGLADEVLKVFDELPGTEIAEARAFTKALNETFYTGAPGKLLSRTQQTVERVPAEAALRSTVGRGRVSGAVDDAALRAAAPAAGPDVDDFARNEFVNKAINASGEFTPKAAKTWMRDNAALLTQNPTLRGELNRALGSREAAQAFAIRAAERSKLADVGPVSEFLRGQPEKAITAILGADNPVKAATSIAATARKDKTGEALAGVKAAFSDYLTRDAEKLPALLSDPRIRSSLSRVFDPGEVKRLTQIGDAMKSLSVKPRDVGEVIDTPANKIVEMIVRVAAAQRGGQMGGGSMGGSLQTANIFAERAKTMLRNLTNDKARQLLMDAVEDPALMRELLMQEESWIKNVARTPYSRLWPYLAGAATAEE